MKETKKKSPVEALHRGLTILELLSADINREGLALAEIADKMQLKRSTTHNLLKTLCICGYAENFEKGMYRSGWKLQKLSRESSICSFSRDSAFRSIAALAQNTGEAFVFAVLANCRRQVIARVKGGQDIEVNTLQLEPDHSCFWRTVTGRILGAFCLPQELEQIIEQEGLPGRYWQNINSEKELQKELEQIRRKHFVRDLSGEIFSIAVPVLGPKKILFGTIGVHLPLFRFSLHNEEDLIMQLQKAAKELAQSLSSVEIQH
mgnify:CR=1 FL=1